MGSQTLDEKTGQLITTLHKCAHGLFKDRRGNTGCEECYEDNQTSSYLLGIAVGFEQASADFSKRAGEAFSAGRDSEAKLFRDLAKEMMKTSEAKRADQEKHDETYGCGKSK